MGSRRCNHGHQSWSLIIRALSGGGEQIQTRAGEMA
jgi:hypothetical protein